MKNIDFKTFSKHLFWDVEIDKLDIETDKSFIIQRVLEYGLLDDWKLIYSYYGLKKISTAVIKLRHLDQRSISFISLLAQIPKENFLCYSMKQSIPKHWNF